MTTRRPTAHDLPESDGKERRRGRDARVSPTAGKGSTQNPAAEEEEWERRREEGGKRRERGGEGRKVKEG